VHTAKKREKCGSRPNTRALANVNDLSPYLLCFFEFEIKCSSCGKPMPNQEESTSEMMSNQQKSMELLERLENYEYPWTCDKCASKERDPIICPICKRNNIEYSDLEFHTHHTSYNPEETVYICVDCHMTIHHSDHFPYLKRARLSKSAGFNVR